MAIPLIGNRRLTLLTFAAAVHDEITALEFAMELGMIPLELPCPLCGHPLTQEAHHGYKLGFRWRCRRQRCGRRGMLIVNPLANTFFSNVHLSLVKVLQLAVFWFFRLPVTMAIRHVGVSTHTGVDFYSFCREVCRVAYSHDEEQIGGPDDVVECDESHLFTRKYHRGRLLRRQMWVFGGISRVTRQEEMIEETASFEAKKEDVEVVEYSHFPADNITEVWLNIFEKLDAEDKITISKTCKELHDWVASNRTCFQFSEVVLMLAQTKNFPVRELLRCRKICKSWTRDFNCVYPAHPFHLRLDTENNAIEENEISTLVNYFTSSQEIQRFLVEMHSHPGNPFPGRCMLLACRLPEEAIQPRRADQLRLIREYYALAIQLLEKYGSHLHIAYFNLWPYGSWMEVMETYKYFRMCLLHIPNLKKLVVGGQKNSHPSLSDEELDFYRQNRLPQLPHLETVWIDSMPHAIWNGLLEASCAPSNVKRLYLSSRPPEMEYLQIPEVAYFPNLEAFEVTLSGEHLERFLNNLDAAPIPLVRTASLNSWDYEHDFGRIFLNLEAFAGSLIDLTLCAAFTKESLRDAFETGMYINLPKLERLKLKNYYGPLDPFCKLPALKFLSIMCYEFQKFEESRVDFFGFEERMEESNIWEKIPSLQEFQCDSLSPRNIYKTYHRDELQLSVSE